MLFKKKKRLGILAIKKGLVNVDQLVEALAVQLKENINDKKNRPIGQILLDLGYITTDELEALLEESFEQRFGDIAVSKEFIKINQLVEAIRIQVEEECEGDDHRLLGDILISMGWLTPSQVNEILDVIQRRK